MIFQVGKVHIFEFTIYIFCNFVSLTNQIFGLCIKIGANCIFPVEWINHEYLINNVGVITVQFDSLCVSHLS